jgi:hypothetical protein
MGLSFGLVLRSTGRVQLIDSSAVRHGIQQRAGGAVVISP